ncbi:MAG: hypothetical protein EBU93_03260 [Chlamydiae bacterium]|jgi:VIT1/CCC1 family predicted Fe2+/Mn2+ transporter|nr:hypothetical protein [Chlamydiota bacterium]
MDHFEGKSAFEHIQDARLKTKAKLKENHTVESKSFLDALIRLMLETSIFLGMIEIFKLFTPLSPFIQISLIMSFILFRVFLSALDGWARLQRLHRVISEERYEIEHHEEQEKEELYVLYQGKGFEGKLLDDVISVLMADKNRLLSVMLDEELGLKIEAYDHPLLQALGALIGGGIVFLPASLLIYFFSYLHVLIFAILIVFLSAFIKGYTEKISRMKTTIWNVSSFLLLLSLIYFGLKTFLGS